MQVPNPKPKSLDMNLNNYDFTLNYNQLQKLFLHSYKKPAFLNKNAASDTSVRCNTHPIPPFYWKPFSSKF